MADIDLLIQCDHDCCTYKDISYDEVDSQYSAGYDLHEGLRIEFIRQPQSLRHVVNIVVALQRMKYTFKPLSTDINERELFSIIMEDVLEARTVMTVEANPSKTYKMNERIVKCTICDHAQKDLVKLEKNLLMLAVTLKAGNLNRRVWFHLSAYTSPADEVEDKGQPVCLGIVESNLYLSCKQENGVPALILENVNDRKSLKTISETDDMERFLFFRKASGESIDTYESVKFPGWFISTAQDENKKVDMCQRQTSRICFFTAQDQSVVSEDQI